MTARRDAGGMVTLDANILGRDYKIACKEGERDELTEAVAYLDRRMREIRDQGKVSGADRIAVMAALNITHDLLRARGDVKPASHEGTIDGAAAERRIHDMGSAIDKLLAGQEKLF